MDLKGIVQALMNAIQKGDFEQAEAYLADDFQFSGSVPKPINAETWLKMSRNLKNAFPNLEYHFRLESIQTAGVVKISTELKGTHKGDLDLTAMNMGIVSATNRSFAAGREHSKLTLRNDKVSSWVVEPNKGSGIMAILSLLGNKSTMM